MLSDRTSLLAVATTLVALSQGAAQEATSGSARAIVAAHSPGYRWGGWGTSLAWWANVFGDSDDLADAFFTLKHVTIGGKSVPGLGLTRARYNAGASSTKPDKGKSMVVSPNMMKSRQIETFWTNGDSDDPQSSSWNWKADAKQRAMLQKAKARGANHFELFSNSPPWWMLINHNPAGGPNGAPNLEPSHLADHGKYMAIVAHEAKKSWGIQFNTVEALNEPSANFWKSTTKQEGCQIPVDQQVTIIKALRRELDRRGMKDVKVAASDENTYATALSTYRRLGASAAMVDVVNAHGYSTAKVGRQQLHDELKRDRRILCMSEHGEKNGAGKSMATAILDDLRILQPIAWYYWQMLDGGGWGPIDADVEAGKIHGPMPKYYVLAHFTRHIRDGMTILDLGCDWAVAAYDAHKKTLVIVAVNAGPAKSYTFDLSRFSKRPSSGTSIRRWATVMSVDGAKYVVENAGVHFHGSSFELSFEADMVQTMEIEGVVI